MGWVRSANRLANKPYRQSAGYLQNANRFLGREKRQFLDFQTENRMKLTLSVAPRTGFEPAAYRLGGGRSIHLSYRGLLTCASLLERCAIRIKGKKRMNLCVLRRRTLYPAELRTHMEFLVPLADELRRLRRRTLYPTELREQMELHKRLCYFSLTWSICQRKNDCQRQ